MTGRRRTAAVVLGAAVLVAGCMTRPGPPETQTRTVSAVSTVDLAAMGELALTRGGTPSLRITAGRNVVDHLTSTVDGDRLTLGSDGSLRDVGPVHYELVLPAARVVELSGAGSIHVSAPSALEEVRLSGSGDVRIDGLRTKSLTVDLSGSGQVAVAGSTSRQRVSISGSGQYSAAGLSSQDAEVTIGGSGDADVTASGTLTATISGSGTVTYAGGAAVTSSVPGSGDVVPR